MHFETKTPYPVDDLKPKKEDVYRICSEEYGGGYLPVSAFKSEVAHISDHFLIVRQILPSTKKALLMQIATRTGTTFPMKTIIFENLWEIPKQSMRYT